MKKIILPGPKEKMEYTMKSSGKIYPKSKTTLQSRIAFSAAHVVCDPLVDISPMKETAIDWQKTLEYRHYLWSLGLSVAEAMDTAQRGMGLDWKTTKKLIEKSLIEAKSVGGGIVCGAGTDQIPFPSQVSIKQIEKAYLEQCEFIEKCGGKIVLMASRHLASCAKTPEDYMQVYNNVLSQVKSPVIIHWLGDMFDPMLEGYWGNKNIDKAMEVCLSIIKENINKIDGIKVSLLNSSNEVKLRNLLPKGVKMYTGDDFNYTDLILGDGNKHSHALLGIFDAIAPIASAAIQALDIGDTTSYKQMMEKTIPLSRHIFEKPTYYYKTGIVFMAYLNGHQSHFRMVGGLESARSIIHLSQIFKLADQADLLIDPEFAAYKMKLILSQVGLF